MTTRSNSPHEWEEVTKATIPKTQSQHPLHITIIKCSTIYVYLVDLLIYLSSSDQTKEVIHTRTRPRLNNNRKGDRNKIEWFSGFQVKDR